jgi:hypothetical protein
MVMSNHDKKGSQLYLAKTCPYCRTYNKVDAKRCINEAFCGKRIGEVDEHGIAKKPTDWWSYISCFLWSFAFFFYIWMLGWSKPLLHQVELMAIWVWNVLLILWGWVWNVLLILWGWVWGSLLGLWDRLLA